MSHAHAHRAHAFDPDAFWTETVPAQVPVVWRGAARDLPLVRLAASGTDALLAHLARRAGARPVRFATTSPRSQGKLGFDADRWCDWAEGSARFDDFLADLRDENARPTGHGLYMQSAPVHTALPELEPLMPAWLAGNATPSLELQLWLGSGGQRVAIHQDASHSVICMAAGEKELFVFPPDQLANLYPAPIAALTGEPWRSRIDPRNPDLARFPRAARAMKSCQRIVLRAGDAMFMPAHWWHAVDSFGLNAMFNYRWHDATQAHIENLNGCLAHVVTAVRDQPADQRDRTWRDLHSRAFAPRPPLTRLERSACLDAIAAGLATPPAPTHDTALVHAGTVRATFDADGAHVSTGAGRCTLPWDFVPLLPHFATPRTADEVIERLQASFDIDPAVVRHHIARLTTHGVLAPAPESPPSAPSATRIEAAVAHARLAAADLPAHHRAHLERLIHTFAFCGEGPPFPDLPPGSQGLLGAPLAPPARQALGAIATRTLRAHYGDCLVPAAAWLRRYQVAPDRQTMLDADGAQFEACDRRDAHAVTWEQLEVLARFCHPTCPADAFDAVRDDWNVDADTFRALVARWIGAGVLVPATEPSFPALSS